MVLYLSGVRGPGVQQAMERHPEWLGLINTPDSAYVSPGPPVRWAADNGAFGAHLRGEPFPFDRWVRWLERQPTSSLFAVVPDVVEDHEGTVALWDEWAPVVRELGHRPAFALQNGCTPRRVPPDADVLFIGGSTEWKVGSAARSIVAELGGRRWVHMGRVNTLSRLQYARAIGCDSVDGTFLQWPDANLPRLLRWLGQVNAPSLFPARPGT